MRSKPKRSPARLEPTTQERLYQQAPKLGDDPAFRRANLRVLKGLAGRKEQPK